MVGEPKSKKNSNLLTRALQEYVRLLQVRPVITKAVTNGCVSAFGNFLSQVIVPDKATGGRLNLKTIAAYFTFGFFVNGPLFHHFYVFLEKMFPKDSPNSAIKRLLFDRLILAPPYLLVFLYYVALAEGTGSEGAVKRIKETYWSILKLNWTVWSVIQYVNVNVIPMKFRTIFGSVCGLLFLIFISVKRRQL